RSPRRWPRSAGPVSPWAPSRCWRRSPGRSGRSPRTRAPWTPPDRAGGGRASGPSPAGEGQLSCRWGGGVVRALLDEALERGHDFTAPGTVEVDGWGLFDGVLGRLHPSEG